METLDTPPAAPITPLGARTPHAHPAFAPVIAVLAAVAAVGIYLAVAYLQGWWPLAHEPSESPSPSPSASASPLEYRNEEYGFEFRYPSAWEVEAEGNVVFIDNGVVNTNNIEVDPRWLQVQISLPPLTAFEEHLSVHYGPVQGWEVTEPSDVGFDPVRRVVLSLGPRTFLAMNMYGNFADNRTELDSFLSSFRLTAPAATVVWNQFSSQYFTLSFKVPPGFDVVDSENSIYVSWGPFETHTIGSDNAFMSLVRTGNESEVARENRMHEFEMSVDGFRRSTVLVDGIPFVRLDGIDKGAFEGDSAGRVALVLFDKSALHILERPGNSDLPFDVMDMTSQILSTFRFAKVPYPAGPFKEASRAQNTVVYSGSATLSGTYELANEGLGGDVICFRASFPSYTQLPNEHRYFCFSNQDDAERLLPVKRGDRCSYAGQATITITDYHANNVGPNSPAVESVDDANITSVARADAPQKNCW